MTAVQQLSATDRMQVTTGDTSAQLELQRPSAASDVVVVATSQA